MNTRNLKGKKVCNKMDMINKHIGKKIKLGVSEPWDFPIEGPHQVEIVDESEEVLLLKLSIPWNYQDTVWEFLAAKLRHEGAKISDIFEGKRVAFNIIRTDHELISEDRETFGSKKYRGKYSMLIGTLFL